ncbi:hypothetical protein FPOAC1_000761 [Fusarium poae]|uniref:Zn(2)-C6 fungal-type domain-containing protein n=1 Tax=Fusarium poae TaxID=36050 RepID=A0A1B8B341_FUSPO|nr:hypothetical protein FPOAC1_000761 [Fusarium poae]KAG8674789.1 hypothetical protein FPOAC1_000761 [Fusarium poae]OBS27154.1 hypothetical protein FPOA_01094 [Fusarium poae]
MADSPKAGIPVRAELDSGQKRNRPERSNATVRASIACVPCRTRHTKCDGFMPHCTRCKEEGQKCHYVSSRRGIRDAKKRNMMRDEVQMADQDDTTESTPSPNLSDFHNPLHNQNRLLDLYYANFHVAHSWAPPKPILELFLKEKPNDVRFLEATIMYIASQYSMVDSSSLRERAFEMSHERLPPTLWNVQALLSLSIASFGEQDSLYRCLFIQARELAQLGGLQPKAYVDQQEGLVLAESCRRTYWGLYVHGMLLGMRDPLVHPSLYSVKLNDDTELPCEEWNYKAGTIPIPVTLAEHDRLGASYDPSSWACLVDLVRIHDCCVAQFLGGCRWETSPDALEDANQNIVSWRNKLKASKMEYVDEDGTVDMILYSALVISYGLQIRMHLHFENVRRAADTEHLNPYIPRLHDSVAEKLDHSLPPLLHAPLRLVSVLNHFMAEKISPSCIPQLDQAAMLLNAKSCHKSKVDFFSSVLGKSSEYWSRSKITLDYLEHTPMGAENVTNTVLQADSPHWIMPSVFGYCPELTAQSAMHWPEQSFSGSPMSYAMSVTTAESFQSLTAEAGSPEEQSPRVKAETQWMAE